MEDMPPRHSIGGIGCRDTGGRAVFLHTEEILEKGGTCKSITTAAGSRSRSGTGNRSGQRDPGEDQRGEKVKIYTVAVNKGGTGKTTTAAALAWAAASQGQKVLAIDLDTQGNFSLTMGADTKAGGVVDFLEGREVVQSIAPGVDMIAASWEAATMQSSKGSARRLQNALAPMRGRYDLAIIDTPPTAGELLYNALQACNGLIIPLFADVYCIQSLYQITTTAAQFKQSNPGLMIKGFILTQTKRGTIYKQMQDTITAKAAQMGVPFLGSVRQGVAISEAAALQKSLFEYAPESNPAKDYLEIYKKIMEV